MTQVSQTLPDGTIIYGTNKFRYVIDHLLGMGGFSAVYRVHDQRTRHHIFALKEIIDAYSRDRRHLIIEAELLKRLQHPSLPRVHHILKDTQRNRIYIFMDYIDGQDLETMRRKQPEHRFPLETVLTLMAPIAAALNYLHSQDPPVVHRDIKPANIIVPTSTNSPQLVDFGLAKEYTEDKTTNVFRYGTPGYAAPEQYGQGTSPRTDTYALAATIYTLLTGEIPRDALARTLQQEDPLKLAHLICPTVPEAIAQVLEQAMALRSEERFDTVTEFWQALCIAALKDQSDQTHLPDLLSQPTSVSEQKLVPATASEQIPQGKKFETAKVRAYILPQQKAQRQRRAILTVLAAILLIALIINGILLLTVWTRPQGSNTNVNTPIPLATATPSLLANCEQVNIPPSSSYPQLAPCYGGTFSNLGVSEQKSNIFLEGIEQTEGNMQGNFHGFGMTGVFEGTVSKGATVFFIVQLNGKEDRFLFEGSIRLGGDLVLNYTTIDQQGQKTYEAYGNGSLAILTEMDKKESKTG